MLTVDGYRASGGIRDAVANTAECLYSALDDRQRSMVRDLMLRMSTPTLEGAVVSTPVSRRLVVGDDEHERLIEQLVYARLVTSARDTVELAHEALVRSWPRLRTWLDDDVEGQRILRHLTLAADGWESMGRPHGELYRGPRLARALAWSAEATPSLTPVESDFLDASRDTADAEQRELVDRSREQARHNRRLRRALIASAMLLVGVLIAGVVAVRSADRARREASAAERTAAGSLVGLAQGRVDEDRGLALLLAVEAHRTAVEQHA